MPHVLTMRVSRRMTEDRFACFNVNPHIAHGSLQAVPQRVEHKPRISKTGAVHQATEVTREPIGVAAMLGLERAEDAITTGALHPTYKIIADRRMQRDHADAAVGFYVASIEIIDLDYPYSIDAFDISPRELGQLF